MNQKQMQYFVTVYETQNIQVAADQLFVTRQGVSKVIRLLETELGQALFTRSSKARRFVVQRQTKRIEHSRLPRTRRSRYGKYSGRSQRFRSKIHLKTSLYGSQILQTYG